MVFSNHIVGSCNQVQIAKSLKYQELYNELGMSGGERKIYRIAKSRSRSTKYTEDIQVTKDDRDLVLL